MTTYPGLQREREIWHACDDLIALGKTVREITGEAISWRLRELKYKAGSKTYIYKYRDNYKTSEGKSRLALSQQQQENHLLKKQLSDITPLSQQFATMAKLIEISNDK